jgi:hypothetical protein
LKDANSSIQPIFQKEDLEMIEEAFMNEGVVLTYIENNKKIPERDDIQFNCIKSPADNDTYRICHENESL